MASLRRLLGFFDTLDVPVANDDRPVGLGSLVGLDDEAGARRWVFLAPDGGGVQGIVDGCSVRLVTPAAPLGRALLGLRYGDVVRTPAGDELDLAIVR